MSFMERLKSSTSSSHRALEDEQFGQRLASGNARREDYIEYLRALAIIYEEVEREPRGALIEQVWDDEMRRSSLLDSDLQDLDAPQVERLSSPLAYAIAAAQKIRQWRREDPAGFVGCLYVLEGSTLGGAVLARAMGQALGGKGVRYLNSYGERRAQHWKEFSARVNSLPASEEASAIEGALGMFQIFSELFHRLELLEPLSANALHEDAGGHPITSCPEELAAALRAAHQSMEEFPYLYARYGERGARFATTDSAWLVALNGHEESALIQEVRWLGVVLASRGMPRLLLEKHLSVLAEQLEKECGGDYSGLKGAAEVLEKERLAVLSSEAAQELETEFRSQAPQEEQERHPDLAPLIVAAITDEANGIKMAAQSLLSWVTDEKWSRQWLDAVERVVSEGRARVSA